jgi:hypothetical protein
MGVVGYVWLSGRPGELLLTTEPAAAVQVLVDDQRLPVDGTPATISLKPGPHALTVRREGYVAYSDQIEIRSRARLARHVPLEPLASAGFKLSEPIGAQVFLDGKQLENATPLQVQSVMPGKHHVEVRGSQGTWAEDVVLEGGKMVELKPRFPGAAPPAPSTKAERERSTPPSVSSPSTKEPREPRAREPKRVAATDPNDLEPPRPKSGEPRGPRSAPAKPSAGGDGYLRIGSKPWTNIAIDGKDTGLHTPQTHLKLPAGSHRITLSNPQFGVKETFSVEISPDAQETVLKNFKTPDAPAPDSE